MEAGPEVIVLRCLLLKWCRHVVRDLLPLMAAKPSVAIPTAWLAAELRSF